MRSFHMRRTGDVLAVIMILGALSVFAGCAGSGGQTPPPSRPPAGSAPGQGRGPGPAVNRAALFSIIDANQDGYVTMQEITDFQNRDFALRDRDKDQRLSREEFMGPPIPPGRAPGQPPGQAPGQAPAPTSEYPPTTQGATQ